MVGEEIDPFVKRVTTIKPGDVVIFRYTDGLLAEAKAAELKAQIATKLGDIPFLLVSDAIDITVLKAPTTNPIMCA